MHVPSWCAVRRLPLTCMVHTQVMIDKQLLNSVLADLVLLHSEFLDCGLIYSFHKRTHSPPSAAAGSKRQRPGRACADMNVRLVLVLGVRLQMDGLLAARGVAPQYVDGYRVTDMEVMTAAAEATGAARVEVEAALSKVGLLHPAASVV
jgi:hypothetical protein